METTAQDIFRKLDLEQLVAAKGYYPIAEAQLIFYYPAWESYVITTISEEREYTVAHYNLLPESDPYQLINGKLLFFRTPYTQHQRISGNLLMSIGRYIEQQGIGECLPVVDVQLDDKNVVRPDLLYISPNRQNIIGNDRLYGMPDLIIEILGENTLIIDREIKRQLYAENDVLEYWIVAPDDHYIEVYHNQHQQMNLVQKAQKDDSIKSLAIEGFTLELDKVFK